MSSKKSGTNTTRDPLGPTRWIAALALILCTGVSFAAQTAEQRFRDLEGLLTRAGRFDFEAHVVSSGSLASDMTADVGVANAGIVVIRMKGTFAGKPADAVMRSDGIVTMMAKDGQEVRLQPGKSMRESVQLGFARVGLWHNLMLLSHGVQPEHSAGDIAEWVHVANVHYAAPKSGRTGLAFDVFIEGEQVGHATLWIDNASKLPVRREQTIMIDGKTINTIEDYSNFVPTA